MNSPRIYLDNNATTLVDPSVCKAILEELKQLPSNPSSVHYEGRQARSRLMQAREKIAACLSVKPSEIIFTSGGTEGVNMLLQGFAARHPNSHIITSDLEHSCVFKTAMRLSNKGHLVTFMRPGLKGGAEVEDVEQVITSKTGLIFLAAANSETGVKTDFKGIAKLAKSKGIPFILDAVALFGKEDLALDGIAGAVFSGHKFHGPKGVGFCLIKKDLKLDPLLLGGNQEYQLRAGTENLPGIAGLAEAVKLSQEHLLENTKRMLFMRNHLEAKILDLFSDAEINGTRERAVNVSNIAFNQIEGELLLTLLDKEGISASLGSACASGSLAPSRILINMGISPARASSSLRFSLSRFTTIEEINQVITVLQKIKNRLG